MSVPCRMPPPRRPGGPWSAVAGTTLILATLALAAMSVPGTGRVGAPTAPTAASSSIPSYWLVAKDGGVFAFGGLPFYGSMGGRPLNAPMVAVAATPAGDGYWEAASDGGVFAFGNAAFHGSMGGRPLNAPVVGMATDPATGGYWEVASDGGIFAFDAPFLGSMGGQPLNQPIVAMAATPSGNGYWLVASDGGVFAYGNAAFHGSMGGQYLAKPIVGMAATSSGNGYWLVASDGGIFAYDAPFNGSLGGQPLSRPIATMTSTGTAGNGGYWMTDDNGAVTSFGDAGYFGSAPQQLNAPVVGMAAGPGSGATGNMAYQSGAYGYDVSRYQCGTPYPSDHTIGVVQVVGASNAPLNSCFPSEVQWAGAGLNLYIFLTYATSTSNEPGCHGDPSCNYGFATASRAYQLAQSAGADVGVTWWLDVETSNGSWTPDTGANIRMILGAVAGLRAQGVNNVGVYSTSYQWGQITGGYQAKLPQWVAGAGSAPDAVSWCTSTNRDNNPTYGPVSFDGGPVWMIQYQTQQNGNTYDGDYAC